MIPIFLKCTKTNRSIQLVLHMTAILLNPSKGYRNIKLAEDQHLSNKGYPEASYTQQNLQKRQFKTLLKIATYRTLLLSGETTPTSLPIFRVK